MTPCTCGYYVVLSHVFLTAGIKSLKNPGKGILGKRDWMQRYTACFWEKKKKWLGGRQARYEGHERGLEALRLIWGAWDGKIVNWGSEVHWRHRKKRVYLDTWFRYEGISTPPKIKQRKNLGPECRSWGSSWREIYREPGRDLEETWGLPALVRSGGRSTLKDTENEEPELGTCKTGRERVGMLEEGTLRLKFNRSGKIRTPDAYGTQNIIGLWLMSWLQGAKLALVILSSGTLGKRLNLLCLSFFIHKMEIIRSSTSEFQGLSERERERETELGLKGLKCYI